MQLERKQGELRCLIARGRGASEVDSEGRRVKTENRFTWDDEVTGCGLEWTCSHTCPLLPGDLQCYVTEKQPCTGCGEDGIQPWLPKVALDPVPVTHPSGRGHCTCVMGDGTHWGEGLTPSWHCILTTITKKNKK